MIVSTAVTDLSIAWGARNDHPHDLTVAADRLAKSLKRMHQPSTGYKLVTWWKIVSVPTGSPTQLNWRNGSLLSPFGEPVVFDRMWAVLLTVPESAGGDVVYFPTYWPPGVPWARNGQYQSLYRGEWNLFVAADNAPWQVNVEHPKLQIVSINNATEVFFAILGERAVS